MPANSSGETVPARVQRVRRRLTDGNVRLHFYHRPTGRRLPDPVNPDFAAAYEAAERELVEQRSREHTVTAELAETPPGTPARQSNISVSDFPANEIAHQVLYFTPEELVVRWRGRIDIDTLANWRSKRHGPPFHRFSGRAILYRADLLVQWESKNMIVCDPLRVIGRESQDM